MSWSVGVSIWAAQQLTVTRESTRKGTVWCERCLCGVGMLELVNGSTTTTTTRLEKFVVTGLYSVSVNDSEN